MTDPQQELLEGLAESLGYSLQSSRPLGLEVSGDGFISGHEIELRSDDGVVQRQVVYLDTRHANTTSRRRAPRRRADHAQRGHRRRGRRVAVPEGSGAARAAVSRVPGCRHGAAAPHGTGCRRAAAHPGRVPPRQACGGPSGVAGPASPTSRWSRPTRSRRCMTATRAGARPGCRCRPPSAGRMTASSCSPNCPVWSRHSPSNDSATTIGSSTRSRA